jgi:nitrate/nitrite-specific signal transduction histidine kinase
VLDKGLLQQLWKNRHFAFTMLLLMYEYPVNTMLSKQAFQEPLVQRLLFLFLLLGVVPTVLLIAAPTIYITLHGPEALGSSLLLMWGAQGVTFLIVVLVGAGVTLKRLVIPIQELVNGAQAIADGNLSYRVPIRQDDQSFLLLSKTFNTMAEAVESMRHDIEQQREVLQTTLDQREREFEAIVAISRLVNHQTELHNTAEQALRITRSVLGAHTISLALLDDAGQITSVVCECVDCDCRPPARRDHCARKQLLRQSITLMQDNLLQAAISQDKVQHIADTRSRDLDLDPALEKTLHELNVRKFAIKPLITRGRALGALVLMRPGPEAIPTRVATLLETLAENIIVLIENWKLQNKSRAFTIMEERRRLASELHDSVTQSLFTLSLTASGLKAAVEHIPQVNPQAFEMLVNQTRVIQSEMRTLINELRPIDLDMGDLESALRQHVQSLRHSTGTEVKLVIRGDVHSLPRPVQQNLNRIAQEALSNIARHAGAAYAEIRLEIDQQLATLTISDDGVGFDPQTVAIQSASCLGLTSMRERAEMLGGALLVRSRPESLTSIVARIPIAAIQERADA